MKGSALTTSTVNTAAKYLEMQIREEKKLAKEIVKDSAEAEKAVIKDKDKEEERKRHSGKSKNNKIETQNKETDVCMENEVQKMGRFVDIKV